MEQSINVIKPCQRENPENEENRGGGSRFTPRDRYLQNNFPNTLKYECT